MKKFFIVVRQYTLLLGLVWFYLVVVVLQAENLKTRLCKFNSRIACHHESCDYVTCQGNVRICKRFLGSSDHVMRRKFSLLRGVP